MWNVATRDSSARRAATVRWSERSDRLLCIVDLHDAVVKLYQSSKIAANSPQEDILDFVPHTGREHRHGILRRLLALYSERLVPLVRRPLEPHSRVSHETPSGMEHGRARGLG